MSADACPGRLAPRVGRGKPQLASSQGPVHEASQPSSLADFASEAGQRSLDDSVEVLIASDGFSTPTLEFGS